MKNQVSPSAWRIRAEFHGTTITSDPGLLAARELDEALGLTENVRLLHRHELERTCTSSPTVDAP